MIAAVTAPALSVHEKIDRLEAVLSTCPQIDHQVEHIFTPGLYIRKLTMPAGSIYTSKIHKTKHTFAVVEGMVSVMQQDGSWQHISAPFSGITLPGTRRVLAVHERTVWLTHHVTQETDLEKIEEQVIERHDFRDSLKQGENFPWHGLRSAPQQ